VAVRLFERQTGRARYEGKSLSCVALHLVCNVAVVHPVSVSWRSLREKVFRFAFRIPTSLSFPVPIVVHHEGHEGHEEITFLCETCVSAPHSAFRALLTPARYARSRPACEHSQAGAKAPKTDLITNDTNPPNFSNTAQCTAGRFLLSLPFVGFFAFVEFVISLSIPSFGFCFSWRPAC